MKFALFNGTSKQEYQDDIIYFLMLKFFKIKPYEVDEMEKERIYKMLWLEEKWKKQEADEQKKSMNKK